MTRAKQKLCLGSPLFQCSKRATSSDFVCDECASRRIDAKRVRFSNYFIFAGEEGSYVCQNPRISAHKFRFVTQYIHMIVFASGDDAAAATEKVNATRGSQYGLHLAQRLPLAKEILHHGFPCALNKHQHRLLPDATTFQDVDIEYLDSGLGDSPPHTRHRRGPGGMPPFGPAGPGDGMPDGPGGVVDHVEADVHAMSPRGRRSSSIIDISAPSGTLTSMMRSRAASHAGAGGSAAGNGTGGRPGMPAMTLRGQTSPPTRRARVAAGSGGGSLPSAGELRSMSVARHFGEDFDESTLCTTAWNRMARRSKLMSEQRMAMSPHAVIRAASPPRPGDPPRPRSGSMSGGGVASKRPSFMSANRPPAFMRSASAAVTTGLTNVVLPNVTDAPRGVKRHRSASSIGDHPTPFSPTATDGSGSSRSSSPPKRARVDHSAASASSSYVFAAGALPARAPTPDTDNLLFDANTPRGGLNTPRPDSSTPTPRTPPALTYQMQNLFSRGGTPTGTSSPATSPSNRGALKSHSHSSAAAAALASAQNMSSGGTSSSSSLSNVASAGDLFPTRAPSQPTSPSASAAGTGDGACALPPLDSTLAGSSLPPFGGGKTGAGLDSHVQSWLDKYHENQAMRHHHHHHLDVMHQRQTAPFLQQNRPFALGTSSANGGGGGGGLGMNDPTAHLSF